MDLKTLPFFINSFPWHISQHGYIQTHFNILDLRNNRSSRYIGNLLGNLEVVLSCCDLGNPVSGVFLSRCLRFKCLSLWLGFVFVFVFILGPLKKKHIFFIESASLLFHANLPAVIPLIFSFHFSSHICELLILSFATF